MRRVHAPHVGPEKDHETVEDIGDDEIRQLTDAARPGRFPGFANTLKAIIALGITGGLIVGFLRVVTGW